MLRSIIFEKEKIFLSKKYDLAKFKFEKDIVFNPKTKIHIYI